MPKKPEAVPAVTQTVVVAPNVKLVTLTNTFPKYVVEKSTDLATWTPVYTGDNGAAKIEIWDSSGTAAAYFRVKQVV